MHARRTILLSSLLVGLGSAPAHAQEPSLAFLEVPPRPHDGRPPPPANAVRGLAELEGELERFGDRMRDYRRTVDHLLRRHARARRRAILARYQSSLRDERRLEGQTRRHAIERLQEFVRVHPDEPRHTPSALLRLAELYVDRAYDEPGSLEPAIRLSRRLVVGFPSSRHRDRAAYLLGWALAESERGSEGIDVWRSVVCGDRYIYPAPPPDIETPESPAHPALTAPEASEAPVQLYAGCRPSLSPLAAEIWLRIGEHHFDAGQLGGAIEAYAHVARHPEDRLYAFGLYKLAWSYYRAARYPEAIERFAQVVSHSDDELARSGRAGSDLREEAIQYIALTLAYDDWNEDGRPDHTQGGPHPLERLEDGRLWPQDRPWSREVYRRVGDVLFEEAHPDEAILAWRLRLTSYPAGCDTPDIYLSIVRAHRQTGDEDAALHALAELGAEVGSDAGWQARSCPGRAARAEELSRNALVALARIRHRRAQRLRVRAHIDGSGEIRAQARAEYGIAIVAYRRYLATYPNSPLAYDIGYDLAEALYWAERHEEAARAYADVRDSPIDDRHFARAARRVVESETRRLESAGVVVRTRAASSPTAVPEALRRVARAREIYVRWVRPREDEEHVRDAYAFNNALLVERYGFVDAARRRYEAIFRARCRGPRASRVGRQAFAAMLDSATAREDLGELERLTREWRERRCTFSPDGDYADLECAPEDAVCTPRVREIEIAVQFRRLRDEAMALDDVPDNARGRHAERIAARLVSLVDRAPSHAQSPSALLLAAHLLRQEAQRPASAERVYQRIVDRVTPTTAELETIVASAHFQLARSAQRAFDYERALASYTTIVESERFAASADPSMAQLRRDAMVNAALLTSRLGRHRAAAAAWTRAAELLPEILAREARLNAAEAMLEGGDAAAAARTLDAWFATGPPSVRACVARARAAEAQGHERRRVRALEAALAAFDAGGRPRGEVALAAVAALSLADVRRAELGDGRIAPGRRATLDAYVAELRRQISRESARVRPLLDAYRRVIELGHAPETVAALYRQGEIYERTIRTVLGARFELPTDVRRRLRRASPAVREQVRARLEDMIRATLDEQVGPVECRAVTRYALAARLARRASLPTPEALRAAERIAAYGGERVAACLTEAHRRDPTFAPYRPGELDRARAGRHLTPPLPVAPGMLAR